MSLAFKTTKGLFWSGIAQVVRQIFQFLIIAILARLLSPSDFGIIGMALVFTSFITIFNEMGVTAAIVQKKNVTREELSSIFYINVAAGLFLTLVTIFLSPLISRFYQKEILEPIIVILSFNFFIGSFSVVQWAYCQKNFEFRKMTIANVSSIILSSLTAVFLAYKGMGVWSLVFQSLSYTFFRSVFLWFASSFRPLLFFNWRGVKSYFVFSSNVLSLNIINYFARNLDYLLIGKYLGAIPLGYYTLGYRVLLSPLRNISFVIGPVLSSAFCSIQENKTKIRDAYLKVIQYISFITFPMMMGVFAIAPEFVLVIYGKQWEPAILLIRILCFTGMIQSIGVTVWPVILSAGRVDIQLKWSIVTVSLTCVAIAIGLRWGVNGVAIAYTLIQFLLWLPSHFIANRLIELRMKTFLNSLTPITLLSSIMLVLILLFKYFQENILNLNNLNLMIISMSLGATVYLSLFKIFKITIINELFNILKEQFMLKKGKQII